MLRKDELFTGQVTPPDADFAYGGPLNESTSGALDGTPWCAESQVDEWALYEALLLKGGITPDGIADTRNRSQLFDALHAVIRGLVAKGFQAQEGATDTQYMFRVPFVTPANPDWLLLQDNSTPTRFRWRQNTVNTASKLALYIPQLTPRFAVNGLAVTVRGTYAGAAQKMRISYGRYSRELTSGSVAMTAELQDGDAVVYPFITLPGTSEPSSQVMFRSYIHVIEVTPQSEPNPGTGVFPTIYSIDVLGKYNPIPAGV
jgi:hypothetical protein